jgi:flavin-dependent dehydrogenase
MTRTVIIGGGLAGGGVAARLATLGRPALVLEREAGAHDKMCGEFLSVEAGQHLAALGLDVACLGGARIDTMRLHVGGRTAEARLPFVATGVTRRSLDAALLDHAVAVGAEVQRGVTVRGLEGGLASTSAGVVDGAALVLATGKHELRGQARDPAGTIDDLIGFKMFFRATPKLRSALAGAVTVTAYDGGYAGLQCVENDRVNLCLLVEQARFKALGGRWETLFAALVREPGLALLADAEALLAKPLTISGVPYGYLHCAAADDGLWRVGDQAAVIPSFCGDGMAMALHGARLAADMLAEGAAPAAFQRRLLGDVGGQVRLATRLQRLANSRAGRFALITGMAAVPGALGLLARWTRVEAAAVARAGA